jgi:hypothetical protein
MVWLALRATRRVSAPSGSASWASLQRTTRAVELTAHDRHVAADLLRGGRQPCQSAHAGLWTRAWVAHAPLLPPTCPLRHLSTSPPASPHNEPSPPPPQQQHKQQRRPALARGTPDGVNAGWTYDEVVNAPNALSLGRAVSGPVLAVFVLQVRVAPGTALDPLDDRAIYPHRATATGRSTAWRWQAPQTGRTGTSRGG